ESWSSIFPDGVSSITFNTYRVRGADAKLYERLAESLTESSSVTVCLGATGAPSPTKKGLCHPSRYTILPVPGCQAHTWKASFAGGRLSRGIGDPRGKSPHLSSRG